MKGTLFRNSVLAATGVFLLLAVINCSHEEEEISSKKEAAAAAVVDKAEYVGSSECKNCHWREHDAWKLNRPFANHAAA